MYIKKSKKIQLKWKQIKTETKKKLIPIKKGNLNFKVCTMATRNEKRVESACAHILLFCHQAKITNNSRVRPPQISTIHFDHTYCAL